jgi:hypothetical protein
LWELGRFDGVDTIDRAAAVRDPHPRLSVSEAHAREWRGPQLPPALDTNLLNIRRRLPWFPPLRTRDLRSLPVAYA